ncbi:MULTISPECIES: CBS domain-containing protein [Methanobacterium]|jgi:CBS domain-containing protein|uniref:CBS domain-containing protein n=1 Tax=Methanobacterium veterum TaxID=408577 RepID=A0A9E4ZZL3_9EURY|nr:MULTISPECIES: CBS domain-containing protein [Methanobacterium]MCZ3366038.1 CBS domain-containing protein [Methanobacterium veterum]MCZ3371734.1 CBS domain-containing protein [Methanobacterium veterum]
MRRKELINIVKSRERAPLEFETHITEHEGDIMSIAKREVVTVPQSATIKESAEIMVKNKFRRLPITDPGTGKIRGIVTAMDILDFLGGGDKYQILEKKHDGNFLSAINDPVREIMTSNVEVLSHKSSIGDAVSKMLKKEVGAFPIIDSDEKIVGIISERDFVFLLSGVLTDEIVEDFMTTSLITTTPGTRIEGASKIMVRNKLRRIPVIGEERKTPHPENDKLVGIVTSTDILKFLGNNTAFEKLVTNDAEEILNTTLSDIMINDVVTTNSQTRLGEICSIMETKGIGGLPVVRNSDLIGIITESDILRVISG